MTTPAPRTSIAPSTATDNGRTYPGSVSELPVSAGDPVWVNIDGADDDLECYMTDDYIAQVDDRVLVTKLGRVGVIVGKVAPQPGWLALSGTYGVNVADLGSPYDVGAYIKLGTVVYLRGALKITGTLAVGSTLFTMPTGCGMAQFGSAGSILTASYARASSVNPLRMALIGYTFKIDFPALAANDNIVLTCLCYPADI
jgi:hypothetical protein